MSHKVVYNTVCTQHILCGRKLTEIAGHYHLYPETVPTALLITAVLVQLNIINYKKKHNILFLNYVSL
jgi:hypothetical protein